MDQSLITRRKPDLDPDLAQMFRRYSARKLLEGFRDYCYAEAQSAQADGFDGMGWLELQDQIEDILPSVLSDADLCGDEIEQEPQPTPAQTFARKHFGSC
jgi:hypothetical protein